MPEVILPALDSPWQSNALILESNFIFFETISTQYYTICKLDDK